MDAEKPRRGGARANAGRKRSSDPKGNYPLRLTGEQRLKVTALGGPEWIRHQIDAAPWPDPNASTRLDAAGLLRD